MRCFDLYEAGTLNCVAHVRDVRCDSLDPWFVADLELSAASGHAFDYQVPDGQGGMRYVRVIAKEMTNG
jgi:hypothetical protein